MDWVDPESGGGATPSLDALVVGTVALMTAWASPCPRSRLKPTELRRVLARKVVSNLFFLQHHPLARPEVRRSMAQAHALWLELARAQDGCADTAPRAAHPALH